MFRALTLLGRSLRVFEVLIHLSKLTANGINVILECIHHDVNNKSRLSDALLIVKGYIHVVRFEALGILPNDSVKPHNPINVFLIKLNIILI